MNLPTSRTWIKSIIARSFVNNTKYSQVTTIDAMMLIIQIILKTK